MQGMAESKGSSSGALAGAAALASCTFNGASTEMQALLLHDLTAADNPARVVLVDVIAAGVELAANAFSAVAEDSGRVPSEFMAYIADTYAGVVGRRSAGALLCYAIAMVTGGERGLEASMVQAAVNDYGDRAATVASSMLLATAWQHQARVEDCEPADLARPYLLVR